MNRRELIAASLASLTAGAIRTMHKGVDQVKQVREPVEAKLEDLEKRFDKLEHHHKNLIRVGGLAFALSTGVDVISFL